MRKKMQRVAIGCSVVALLLTVGVAQGAMVYVDAVGGVGGNIVQDSNDSPTSWLGPQGNQPYDGLWNLRTSASETWVYNTTMYEMFPEHNEGGTLPIRMDVGGLQPNTEYTGLRVYYMGRYWNDDSTGWYMEASSDGTNFTRFADGPSDGTGGSVGFGDPGVVMVAVDTDSNGGLGAPITPDSEVNRIYAELPNGTTNGAGTLSLWVMNSTSPSQRTRLDGFAYDNTPGATRKPGDVNDDTLVNQADFEIIRSNFFGINVGRSAGDLNLDGIVNLKDFGEWKDHYPGDGGAMLGLLTGVPEPGSAGLAAIGILIMGVIRRRSRQVA